MLTRRSFLALFIIALIAGGAGFWLHQQTELDHAKSPPQIKLANADVIFPTHPVAPFQLTGDNNQTFSEQNLKNQWTMIFFGFTHCEMLCPTTLTTLNQAYKMLQAKNQLHNLNVLFVSVDPDRDNISNIKKYVAKFNPQFRGATGNENQLQAITKQFGVLYSKIDMPNQGNGKRDYTIDHSGVILLINPKGELAAIFSLPHEATKIAQDYALITENYS